MMGLPAHELSPLRFYALSIASQPVLEILGTGDQVVPLPMTAVGQGRHAAEKLWVADLSGANPGGKWRFRLQLDGTKRAHPPYAPFYTTLLRSAWLQDGRNYVEGVDFQCYLDEGATHSEGAWASRLPQVFRFLFPANA